MLIMKTSFGAAEFQMFPVFDARHQFDSKQVRKSEDHRRLPVSVGMNEVGLNVTTVLQQAIKNENCFAHAAGNEMREQRDVFVRDVVVPLSEGLSYVKEAASLSTTNEYRANFPPHKSVTAQRDSSHASRSSARFQRGG